MGPSSRVCSRNRDACARFARSRPAHHLAACEQASLSGRRTSTLTALASPAVASDARTYARQGMTAFEKGDVEESIKLFDAAEEAPRSGGCGSGLIITTPIDSKMRESNS